MSEFSRDAERSANVRAPRWVAATRLFFCCWRLDLRARRQRSDARRGSARHLHLVVRIDELQHRERVVEHAHNDFAELLAETGVVGMGLALIGVAVFLPTAFHKANAKVDDLGGCIRLGAAVGCCGLLVHSLSDFNLHVPANAAWFVACAAISQLPPRAMHTINVRDKNNGRKISKIINYL